MAEISGLGGLNSIDSLVNSFLEVERRPIQRLETDKKDYQLKLTVFSDLKSELKTLRNRMKGFLSVGSEATLGSKTAISSNSAVVTAEASASAETGVNSIFVTRIAKRDSMLTDRIDKSKDTIARLFTGATQRMYIKVGDGSLKAVDVNFSDHSETNESALKRIADAVNDADIGVTANTINVDSKNMRISLTADESGSSNAITVEAAPGSSFAATLGLIQKNPRDTATNT